MRRSILLCTGVLLTASLSCTASAQESAGSVAPETAPAPTGGASPAAPAAPGGATTATPAPAMTDGTLPAGPLTLNDAVRVALANHRQIAIAQSQQVAAGARVTQSRSAYFPALTPSYRYSRQHTAFDTGQGTQTGTITQNVASIGLDQLLFDMGKRELNMARSKDAAQASTYNLADVRQAVALNATLAWYELRRSKDLVRVAESGAERARTTLEATRAFVEAGSSARKDVLQAQADYDNAQVQVIQARNSVRLAETALKNAMGVRTSAPVTTVDTPVAPPSETADTRTAEAYIEQAFSNRPDLMRSAADIRSTSRSVKIARIEAGPQVSSSFTAGYRAHPDPGSENQLLANVSYPLFDAGAARAAVREARASLEQARQSDELNRQDIAAEVESDYLLREEARTRVGAAQTALAAAQENFSAATESQKEGVGTILDVITAQNQLITAETSAVQAVYDFYTAEARLQRAIGATDVTVAGTTASDKTASKSTETDKVASEGRTS